MDKIILETVAARRVLTVIFQRNKIFKVIYLFSIRVEHIILKLNNKVRRSLLT